ncbi:MAG TPA: NADH-quinone oxidoreductase subunit N [Spirochaetia bacterium]|nr:NADH-quinone oxidoreductase subunit N [Spirochaetia bacterium]
MSQQDILVLLPFIVVAGASILVLLAAAFVRSHGLAAGLTLAGFLVALASLGLSLPAAPRVVAGLLTFDKFVAFGIGLVLAASVFVTASSWAYLRGHEEARGEYYFLLLLASLGSMVLAAATAFATFFLGLELLSVSLYTMIAWRRERGAGAEAGIKYLVLAGATAAFLLFGMALLYAASGSMDISMIARGKAGGKSLADGILAIVGLGMILVALGFKLAVVPFHLWTPDVYDGSPAPVAGYIATVSKGAVAVLLIRLFIPMGAGSLADSFAAPAGVGRAFPWVFTFIAALSMFIGNFLALRENNVKRILAYSSIAHLGYLLVAFIAGGTVAARAVSFYLVAYFATTLAAFAVVAAMSAPDREADMIEDYAGLAFRSPWLAGVFTAALLSLAGLPLTAGFVGKFILLSAGAGAQLWALIIILAVNGTISIFYYLKIVSAMYRRKEEPAVGRSAVGGEGGAAVLRQPFLAGAALALLTLVVVGLGVYPGPVLSLIGLFTQP